jgi:predicted Rossmann fold nucleotide-binding protein DprA/Smf involved in DNA uptake
LETPLITVRIISGGQTGVDRAALDVALALGIPCGGWCPRGRRAEDGTIGVHYPLRETPTEEYAERTERNVCDSDGTLILTRGAPDGGTALTAKLARRHRKPLYVVDLAQPAADEAQRVQEWLVQQRIDVLNVAGPRESVHEGIHAQAMDFLRMVLEV